MPRGFLIGHPHGLSAPTKPVALIGSTESLLPSKTLTPASHLLYFKTKSPVKCSSSETTTDLRKTRCQVESKDDISKTRQGYKIETAGGETACFSEEDVESISVMEK